MEYIPIVSVVVATLSACASVYGLKRSASKDRVQELRDTIEELKEKLEECERLRLTLEKKIDYQGRRMDELQAENVRLMREIIGLKEK